MDPEEKPSLPVTQLRNKKPSPVTVILLVINGIVFASLHSLPGLVLSIFNAAAAIRQYQIYLDNVNAYNFAKILSRAILKAVAEEKERTDDE